MREEVFFKNFSYSLLKRFFIAMKLKFVASMVQKTFYVRSLMQFLFQKHQQPAFRRLVWDAKNNGRHGTAGPIDARERICALTGRTESLTVGCSLKRAISFILFVCPRAKIFSAGAPYFNA
jgi:hypothetical protein